MRGVPFGDVVTSLGALGPWMQAAANKANAVVFAERIAWTADSLVASHVFGEPAPEHLANVLDNPLWTTAAERIERDQAAHRNGTFFDHKIDCDIRLTIWLLPKASAVLVQGSRGRVDVAAKLKSLPFLQDCALPLTPSHTLSSEELASRQSLWAQARDEAVSCKMEMHWSPQWPTMQAVQDCLERPPVRAQRLAKERALEQFTVQARAAKLPDFPEESWRPKGLALLANPNSALSLSYLAERNKLTPALLPPSSLAARFSKPLSTVVSRL